MKILLVLALSTAFAAQQAPARDTPATPAQTAKPAPTGSGRIAGRVMTTDQNPQPVRRAVVLVTGGEMLHGLSAVTDDEGRFTFSRLPAGRFSLSASRPAFVTSSYGATQPGRPGTPITLTAGQQSTDIVIRLARGAAITGVIRDLNGEPAVGVQVAALRVRPPTASSTSTPSESFVTDDRGVYRAFGLTPGPYVIAATLRSTTNFTAGEVELRSSEDVDVALQELQRGANRTMPAATTAGLAGTASATSAPRPAAPRSPEPTPTYGSYAPTFYPGTAAAAEALPITVGAGEERTGIDLILRPVASAAIEGVVTSATGTMPALQMSISSDASALTSNITGLSALSFSQPSVIMQPGRDGKFKYVGVTPGRYTIIVRSAQASGRVLPGTAQGPPPPNAVEPVYWAVADLTVNGTDITGVTLALQPAPRVSGRVVFEGTSIRPPPDLTKLRIQLASPPGVGPATMMNGVLVSGRLPITPALLKADGTFEIAGVLPNVYQLTMNAPGTTGWWLRSATVGGRDVLDGLFEVPPNGADVTGVEVKYTDRHTELSGTLQTPAGLPATEYFVLVFSADRSQWRAPSRRLVSTRPASDGKFAIKDLPPGEYYVAALTDVDPDEWQTPAFLDQVVAAAIKLTIGEGETKTQDIRIAR